MNKVKTINVIDSGGKRVFDAVHFISCLKTGVELNQERPEFCDYIKEVIETLEDNVSKVELSTAIGEAEENPEGIFFDLDGSIQAFSEAIKNGQDGEVTSANLYILSLLHQLAGIQQPHYN